MGRFENLQDMKGETLKQYARSEFFRAMDEYKIALNSGQNIVAASVRVHATKAGVPKSFWPMVNRIFKNHNL